MEAMEGYAFEQKFKSIMALNNDTIDKLSEYLHMARQTLSRKIANGTFDMEEMTKIKIRYNLSDEAYAQLFTKEVES